MASLAAAGLEGTSLLAGLAGVLFVAGLAQMLIGLSGGGHLIKYIPFPVVAGFLTGSAVLMALSQLRPLSGAGADGAWHSWRWLPAATAAVTFLGVRFGPRLLPRLPGTITGLLAGTAVFQLVAWRVAEAVPASWVVGALPQATRSCVCRERTLLRRTPRASRSF